MEERCGTAINASSALIYVKTLEPEVCFYYYSILKSVLASSSGILPPAIVQESRVPQFYRDTIAQCGAENINKLPNQNVIFYKKCLISG